MYQNALKLHSQGPDFFSEAEAAYKELFKSEIFTYPESLSEAKWLELYGDVEADDEDEEILPEAGGPTPGSDGTPSTLPQILYLAYKNYGSFRLDQLRHRLTLLENQLRNEGAAPAVVDIEDAATTGLEHLADALSRDETDLELWRKVSRISEYLGSSRLARYCLESVLQPLSAKPSDRFESFDLEERFAVEQLRSLLPAIQDDLSETQMRILFGQHRVVSKTMRKHVDPCSYLPSRPAARLGELEMREPVTTEIPVSCRSWTAVGKALLFQLQQESQGIIDMKPGSGYRLQLPPSSNDLTLPDRDARQAHRPAPLKGVSDIPVKEFVGRSKKSFNDPEDPAEPESAKTLLDSPLQLPVQSCDPAIIDSPTKTPFGLEEAQKHNKSPEQLNALTSSTNHDDVDPEFPKNLENLPTRKRSSDDADLAEPADAVRSRSKRIKARGSLNEVGGSKEEWNSWYSEQLKIYANADDLAFRAADNISSNIESERIGSLNFDSPKQALLEAPDQAASDQRSTPSAIAIRALEQYLDSWDLVKSRAFLGGSLSDPAAQSLGISAFVEQAMLESPTSSSKMNLVSDMQFGMFEKQAQEVRFETLGDLALFWLSQLLSTQQYSKDNSTLYESHRWGDTLKETVVKVLVQWDEPIYLKMQDSLRGDGSSNLQFIQALFELHLDIYGRITNPNSKVDNDTRALQRDRLSRWASLAAEAINRPQQIDDRDNRGKSLLELRFLWFTVIYNVLLDPGNCEQSVLFYQDLIGLLRNEARSNPDDLVMIELVNNAWVPEISVKAAEREISRLTTVDFFTSIFSSADEDPFTVIDSLEPLLELSITREAGEPGIARDSLQESRGSVDSSIIQAHHFLERASLTLRLSLWEKLRDAYSVINYPSMILSCNLRSLTLVVQELGAPAYQKPTSDKNGESYLHWLHKIDDLINSVVAPISADSNAFECIDNDQIRSVISTLKMLIKVLHVFARWEDSIRVGQIQPQMHQSASANKAQNKAGEKFREMIVKVRVLQYHLFKEAIIQNQERFPTPNDDLLDYLRLTHYSLGLRTYCGLAQKSFLRLAKSEMLRMKPHEGWDTDMPQIMFDLYGLKISSNAGEMLDHGCEALEIDKSTALEVIDLVMLHVNRLSLKDLLRNDLRSAVEKLQQVIKVPKLGSSTAARSFNKRLISAYLSSPINPVELFRSPRGVGGLCSSQVRTDGWEVAQKGWYFLLGHISLSKFRSQKRTAAGSTEDLENAKIFFKHDLEFDAERWETWYRLGQVFDTLLDEYTTWTSDKIENNMALLIDLQRQAILCYNMAVAIAGRLADATFEDTSKMAELYADYGARIYSSSREPFSMEAFRLDEFERHYNGASQGMYKDQPFKPLQVYPAWKLASALLRQASLQKPNYWITHYHLGKVLWKMHNCSDETLGKVKRIPFRPVVDALVYAVKCLPDRKDGRHPDKDPVLEPHYKLLSVVHKEVRADRCSAQEGCRILRATHYAGRVPAISDAEDWIDFVQEVLKAMRSADKLHWHHRLAVRAARIFYDTDPHDIRAWMGAKHELTQQIFTKTMTIQVWKPNHERAGRHFVYMNRYVRFFSLILFNLKDKENLEALARRIRKRNVEFVDHIGVWQSVTDKYLSVSSTGYCVQINLLTILVAPSPSRCHSRGCCSS